MKYFNPSYWFKLWVLSAPLFNDQTQGINVKLIDNKNITSLESINESNNLTNSSNNYEPYNLSQTNHNIDLFYQTDLDSIANKELETTTHKHRHEKNRNRTKRCGYYGGCFPGILGSGPDPYQYGATVTDSTRKIKFYGYDDWYKGEIKFNSLIKKIEFEGNSDYFHRYFGDGGNTKYLGITIYDQNEKLIQDININAWDWMTKIINDYNLKNGIDYQEGYIIKIYSKEPWRTLFNIENNNFWKRCAFIDGVDWDWTWKYRIRNNNIINKDNDLLWKDFSDVYSSSINLGLIDDNNQNDIRHAIKQKNPNFHINTITFSSEYSQFCMCFSAKGYINYWYSTGELRPIFTYITKTKLKEISECITNDSKVKQWLNHINDWNSTLSQAITNAKTFSPELLYNWKRHEKEIIKGYIRDWSYVHTLIEYELKIDELNKNIQGLKTSFDNIKTQVDELEQKVNNLDKRGTDLENVSNVNCANIAGIVGSSFSVIPILGTITGTIGGITAGVCAIAGV